VNTKNPKLLEFNKMHTFLKAQKIIYKYHT